MPLAKCQTCGEKANTKEMELLEKVHESGNKTRWYAHKGECWDKFTKIREETDKENEERDAMYEVIKEIHHMQIIPNSFFSGYLTPVRNGNFKLGKRVVKKKEGYTFIVIKKAYEISKGQILTARKGMNFDSAMSELRYCFAIVIDNLPAAQKKLNSEKRQGEMSKVKEEIKQAEASEVFENKKVEFKKKDNKKDISRFLD
jgi:hypothetical protein